MSPKDGTETLLTGGEECQRVAKILSSFIGDKNAEGNIPQDVLSLSYAIAVFEGSNGVSVARLQDGELSAPCAITLCTNFGGHFDKSQLTLILLIKESTLIELVLKRELHFGNKNTIVGGPMFCKDQKFRKPINIDSSAISYVKIKDKMIEQQETTKLVYNWKISEDSIRQARWHKKNATWAEILTNKITVDRSSIGNALYVIINIACPKSLIQVKGVDIENLKKSISNVSLKAEYNKADTEDFNKNSTNINTKHSYPQNNRTSPNQTTNVYNNDVGYVSPQNSKDLNSKHKYSDQNNNLNSFNTPLVELVNPESEGLNSRSSHSVLEPESYSSQNNDNNIFNQVQRSPQIHHTPPNMQQYIPHTAGNAYTYYQQPNQVPFAENYPAPPISVPFQQIPHTTAPPQVPPYYTQPIPTTQPYHPHQFPGRDINPMHQNINPHHNPYNFISSPHQHFQLNYNQPYPPINSHIPPQNQPPTSNVTFMQMSSVTNNSTSNFYNVRTVSHMLYDQNGGVQQHRSESVYFNNNVNNNNPYMYHQR